MPHRKIIRRKVITNQGTSYVTVRHTNHHGIEHMHRLTVDGVKRLVPLVHVVSKHIATHDIDHNLKHVKPTQASATDGITELSVAKKMGGGLRTTVKPTRSLIMREINHALRR